MDGFYIWGAVMNPLIKYEGSIITISYFHENGHAEIVNRRGSLFSQDLNRTDAATISLPSQKNRKAPAQGGATPKHLE